MAAAERELAAKKPTRTLATQLPFLVGVFEFPWYLNTLQVWLVLSAGFTTAAFLIGFLLGPGAAMGTLGYRLIGPGAFGTLIFTVAYAFTCCLRIIEETAHGAESIQDWPPLVLWKDWMWAFFKLIGFGAQAALAGLILTLGTWFYSPFPVVIAGLVAFPFILLSCLETDSWIPLSRPILQSLVSHGWAWVFFYAEAGGVLMVWIVVTTAGLAVVELWCLLISAPLFAAVVLIWARLLGRLAWCIGR